MIPESDFICEEHGKSGFIIACGECYKKLKAENEELKEKIRHKERYHATDLTEITALLRDILGWDLFHDGKLWCVEPREIPNLTPRGDNE